LNPEIIVNVVPGVSSLRKRWKVNIYNCNIQTTMSVLLKIKFINNKTCDSFAILHDDVVTAMGYLV
jgi:hypothetical protein